MPFRLPCRAAGLFAIVLAIGLCTLSAHAAAPSPVISVSGTQGMVPFTVHVNAMSSGFGAGSELTSRIKWDFGDPQGMHNKLVGFNAAHVYTAAGSYTITLKIINQDGLTATATRQIIVQPNTRSTIYVAANGNDGNPGTQAQPIRTAARAAQMLHDNTYVRFRRGDTFNLSSEFNINKRNVVIGTYGSGNRPVLRWTPDSLYNSIITMGSNARDVALVSLAFDSANPPTSQTVRGVQPQGSNITIRSCRFKQVSYAMNCELGVNQFLAINNVADVLGAYFSWVVGDDHSYVGNTVAGSLNEHNIRVAWAHRILIAKNKLTNTYKSTVWCMLGQHCYVTGNTLKYGRLIGGPNFAAGDPVERVHNLVIEGNKIVDEGIILYSGAEDTVVRNNIVRRQDGEAISIWGWYAPMSRTVRNVVVANNTGINVNGTYGRFLRLGEGAEQIVVRNNLYLADNLNSEADAWASNVTSEDMSIDGLSFRNNIWAKPHDGNACHRLATGGFTGQQWNAMAQTTSETHRVFAASDLNSQYTPQFNARTAKKVPGVHVDFYGRARPVNSDWNAGAVE